MRCNALFSLLSSTKPPRLTQSTLTSSVQMGQSIAASNHGAAIDQDKQEIKQVKAFTTDLIQLKEDMNKMSQAYDVVMNIYNDGKNSYTEALPELFILSIEGDVFKSYMESLTAPLEKVSEIVVNHCSSYSCGKGKTCWKSCAQKNNQVLQDAKLLTDVLGTQITSMNSFYQKCEWRGKREREREREREKPADPPAPPPPPITRTTQTWNNNICSSTRNSTRRKIASSGPSSRKGHRWRTSSTRRSTRSRPRRLRPRRELSESSRSSGGNLCFTPRPVPHPSPVSR